MLNLTRPAETRVLEQNKVRGQLNGWKIKALLKFASLRIPTHKKPSFIKMAVIFKEKQQLYLPLSCVRFGSDILRKSSDVLLRRLEYPLASPPPPL